MPWDTISGIVLLLIGLGAAVLATVLIRPRFAVLGLWGKLLSLAIGIYALTAWLEGWAQISLNLGEVWSAPRLSLSFALRQGLPIYYGPEQGPLLSNYYGPMMAVSYLPSAFFGHPEAALWSGGAIAALLVFGAVAGAHFFQARGCASPGLCVVVGTLLFHGLLTLHPVLVRPAFQIHADAPAIGFALLACSLLGFRDLQGSRKRMFFAALFATLSIWTKQVMVPLVLALPLWVWLLEGKRAALQFTLIAGAVFLGVTAIFLLWFDPGQLWFCMVTVQAHHPWHGSLLGGSGAVSHAASVGARLKVLAEAALLLGWHGLQPLLLIGGGLLLEYTRKRSTRSGGLAWLRQNRWMIFLGTGVLLAPMSMLGRVKVGGDTNAFSYSAFFIFTAASLYLVDRGAAWLGNASPEPKGNRGFKLATAILLAVCTVALWRAIPAYRKAWTVRECPTTGAVEYARAHPGTTWFPWNPLVSIMAEKRAYHFDYGLLAHEQGGYRIGSEHLRSHLPPDLEYIVNLHGVPFQAVAGNFPNIHRVSPPDPMPEGWVVYRVAPVGEAAGERQD